MPILGSRNKLFPKQRKMASVQAMSTPSVLTINHKQKDFLTLLKKRRTLRPLTLCKDWYAIATDKHSSILVGTRLGIKYFNSYLLTIKCKSFLWLIYSLQCLQFYIDFDHNF